MKDGEAIQNELVSGLEGARDELHPRDRTGEEAVHDRCSGVPTGVQDLGSDVQQELTAVGAEFNTLGDKYEDTTLNKATSDEPACSEISG